MPAHVLPSIPSDLFRAQAPGCVKRVDGRFKIRAQSVRVAISTGTFIGEFPLAITSYLLNSPLQSLQWLSSRQKYDGLCSFMSCKNRVIKINVSRNESKGVTPWKFRVLEDSRSMFLLAAAEKRVKR